MVIKAVITFFLIVEMCYGVIYRLNESEYERMPPLFGMDSNYHSCLREPGGVYCVAKFELHGDPDNELIHIIKEYSLHENKHYNHSYIDRAICVTQSCKKLSQNKTLDKIGDLSQTLEGCVNYSIWTEYGLNAKLSNILYCDRHGDRNSIDIGDFTLLGILILVLASNFVGSVYDIWYKKKRNEKNNGLGNKYLLSFSIFRNWETFSNTDTDPRYLRLRGVHGLKSITTFFIALAHVMWLVGTGFTDNPRDLEMSYEYLHYQVIFSGMVIVQIFFVISGCLLTFHLQMLSENGALTWRDVARISFFRWARLTPAYAIVLLFTATWLRHLGSGPLWNMSVQSVAIDCRVHWWKHLLYFNNYVPEDKYCAVHTWHVASELQLFTIGLAVYVATTGRRYLALTVLALLGMVAPAMHVYLQDLDALVIFKPEFYRMFDNDTYRYLHTLGHNNLACHAIGMAVGLVSYHCVKHRVDRTDSKVLKFITWCIPLAIVGLFLSGNWFYVDGDRPHVGLRMAYAALQRPALGVMTAILILNLVMKFENAIRSVLEWRGWVVPDRLCYGVYLLHVNLVHVLLGARTQLGHVAFFHVIVHHFGVVSLSLAAAVPFYLMIELPLTSLTKLLLTDAFEAKRKKMK